MRCLVGLALAGGLAVLIWWDGIHEHDLPFRQELRELLLGEFERIDLCAGGLDEAQALEGLDLVDAAGQLEDALNVV